MAKIKGFTEWLPEEELLQQQIISTLQSVFELHAFTPLRTRSIELLTDLFDQGETDKEIYGVQRLAAESDAEVEWGLHYDLTVPFARYVAENQGKLTFPFRRYQIQPAWRGERPQLGRFREFIQADADIVVQGELDVRYDAELVGLLQKATAALPVPPIKLMVNNRKLLEGFYRGLGLEESQQIVSALRAIDKLPKLGEEKTIAMLVDVGMTQAQAEKCLALTAIEAATSQELKAVNDLGVSHPLLEEGLKELSFVLDETTRDAEPGSIVAALHIARGFDYYTGTVVEGVLRDHSELGSVCSGGRYDSLIAGSMPMPGVGVSVGVSRLLAFCFKYDLLETGAKSPADVMVAVISETDRQRSNEIAQVLRSRGIATLVSDSSAAYGKQIKAASRLGIDYVWFPNPEDGGIETGNEVKNIVTGEQISADLTQWQPKK